MAVSTEINDSAMAMSASLDSIIEDDDVQIAFARVLKDFRVDFGNSSLGDVVERFKKIAYKQLLDTYSQENASEAVLENWILEGKLWSLVQALLDVKFEEIEDEDEEVSQEPEAEPISLTGEACSYSSNTVLQDKILSQDQQLLKVFTVLRSLSESSNLDLNRSEEVDVSELQLSNWLNTKVTSNPGLPLDKDAPARAGLTVDPRDVEKDDLFFKKAFGLLLNGNTAQLNELCKETNNWDFAMIACGLQDYLDPAIDLHDFTAKPIGIKHKLLWRKAVFKMVDAAQSKYERACYGFLCGDFLSCEAAARTWEEKLQLYLNNLFQSSLETRLVECYKQLSKVSELEMIASLPSPSRVAKDISDALNKLAADKDPLIQKQSRHPIRVIIGSVISDRVHSLMQSTLHMLDSIVAGNESSELTNSGPLLRILTHLALLVQLIYGTKAISDDDYAKLLKSYTVRLALYKLYDQIPVYLSFIPDDVPLIAAYSHFLTNFEFSTAQRESQLRLMRQLNLPMEAILRDAVSGTFDLTAASYPVGKEVILDRDVSDTDKKVYSSIYWLYDSGMAADCLEAVVMVMRRFLLCGKLQAGIDFLASISLPRVIDDYRRKTSIIDEDSPDESLKPFIVSKSRINELIQYQQMIKNFSMISEFEEQQQHEDDDSNKLQQVIRLAASLDELLRTWMYDLANDTTIDPASDIDVYRELRSIYIPTIFTTLFDLLIEYRHLSQDVLFRQAVSMVNLLADNKYKFYELFKSRNELKPFLQRFAEISCTSYGEREGGIYDK